jgi:hypothetical protein
MSNVSKSDLVAILTDYDERHAPLDDPAMRLSVVADVAFIEVGHVKEDGKSTTFACTKSVGVDAELLLHTLTAMIRQSDRNAEQRAREGTLPADHSAWTTQVAPAVGAAVRRRT